MKVTVNERGTIQLENVFNPIKLVSTNNEELIICMRDGGFEMTYQGKWYSLKENELSELSGFKTVKSNDDNVEQLASIYGDAATDKTATFQIPA